MHASVPQTFLPGLILGAGFGLEEATVSLLRLCLAGASQASVADWG